MNNFEFAAFRTDIKQLIVETVFIPASYLHISVAAIRSALPAVPTIFPNFSSVMINF